MRKLSIPFALAALLTGCATTPNGTAPLGPFALAGSQWRFITIDDKAASGEATIDFQSERFVADAGCNRMGATWRQESNKLIVGPLMATRMFCEGKMDQERAVSALMEASPEVMLKGNQLTLKANSRSAELVRDNGEIDVR